MWRICCRHGRTGSARRVPAAIPVPDYSWALPGSVKGLRIGVPTQLFLQERPARNRDGLARARWLC